MRFGSGSPAGVRPFKPCRIRWPVTLVVIGLMVLATVAVVRGSCTVPPEIPALARARDLCLDLTRGRNADCQWKVKRRFNIEIIPVGGLPETAYFTLRIRGEEIGTFPIPDAIPVDLTTLDAGIIHRLLYLRMGSQEVQEAIKARFGRGTFYIESIVEWKEPDEEGGPSYLSGVGALARRG